VRNWRTLRSRQACQGFITRSLGCEVRPGQQQAKMMMTEREREQELDGTGKLMEPELARNLHARYCNVFMRA